VAEEGLSAYYWIAVVVLFAVILVASEFKKGK
jgi:hypothetical protein